MRCVCCNSELSDYESTRKSATTGEYLDMCNDCLYLGDPSDFALIERPDLVDSVNIDPELDNLEED